jgi:hypothetical protein
VTMATTKAIDVLREALSNLPPSAYMADRHELGPLHQTVCDAVDELKAEGAAPEHVLLAIKGIAFEAMMGPLANVLMEKMVTWCLEQYFKETSVAQDFA